MARATFEKLMRLSSAAEVKEERRRQELAEAVTRRLEDRLKRRHAWQNSLSLPPLEVGTRLWREVSLAADGTKTILDYPQDVLVKRTDRGSLMFHATRGPEMYPFQEHWACRSWVAGGLKARGPIAFIDGDLPTSWTYLAVTHIARKTVADVVRLTVFARPVVGRRDELLAQYGFPPELDTQPQ